MTDSSEQGSAPTDETGSAASDVKSVATHFGPYTIIMRLTATNQFVDIVKVLIDKDFRSTEERIRSQGFHDVSDLYEDKEK